MNPADENIFDDDVDLNEDLNSAAPPLYQILQSLQELDEHSLILLRTHLNSLVPELHANEVDLSIEIAEQYRNAKALMTTTLAEKFVPPTQKSATVRTVTSALRALTDLQTRAFNIDTNKKLEQALMLTLSKHPDAKELIASFKENFERLTGRAPTELK